MPSGLKGSSRGSGVDSVIQSDPTAGNGGAGTVVSPGLPKPSVFHLAQGGLEHPASWSGLIMPMGMVHSRLPGFRDPALFTSDKALPLPNKMAI